MSRPTRRTSLSSVRPGLLRLEDRTTPNAYSWTGGPNGLGTNWFDANNWFDSANNVHAVPGAGDDATVNAPGAGQPGTLVFNGAGAVHTLIMNRTLDMTGGSLSLGNGIQNFGTYVLDGGTLDIQNGAYLQNFVINGPGTLTLPAGRTISIFATTINAATTNSGTIVVPLVNSISGFTANAAFTNSGGIIWLQGGRANFNGTLVNHGTLRLEPIAPVMPTDTLTVSCGANSTNAADGSIIANAGTGGRRALSIGNQSTFDQSGLIQTNGVNLTINSGAGNAVFNVTGPLSIGNGTTIVNGYFMTINYNGGAVTGGGTWDLTQQNTTIKLNSSFTDAAVDVTMDSGTRFNGPGTFTHVSGRTITTTSPTFNAPVVNQSGGTLRFLTQAGFLGPVTNHGAIELTSASNQSSGIDVHGVFTNSSDGSVTSLTGAGGNRTIRLFDGALFDNQGLIHVVGGALSVFNASSPNPTFQTSGTLSIDAGQTLTTGYFSTIVYMGGPVTGGGVWSVTGSFTTFNLNTDLSNTTATINVDGTTVNGPGRLLVAAGRTFTTTGTTINAAVVNNGSVVVSGGQGRFLGGFTNAAGTMVTIQPTSGANAVAEFAGGLTNNGTLVFDGNGTGGSTELYFNSGTLLNGPGGSIVSSGGAGVHRFRFFGGVGLNNQGSITLNGSNLTFSIFGGTPTFQNSGVVSIGAGTTFQSDAPLANSSSAIVGGNGTFVGNITGTGTISPGTSTGILTVNGNVSLGGFIAELNGTTPGTQHDRLVVNGTVTIGGALTVVAGYAAVLNDSYSIIVNDQSEPIIGAFTSGTTVVGSGQTFSVNYAGASGNNDVSLTRTGAATLPPLVAGTQVNDGSTQRSRVTSLKVTFDRAVSFATSAAAVFTLIRNSDSAVIGFTATPATINGATVVTLSAFSGTPTQIGSLADGRYTLTVLANQVSAGGQQMAGNYTFGDAQSLFRYYGDMNGDRRVDISDFGFFSLAFLQPANYDQALDFNGDGRIDIADFGQFSVRYFTTLP